MPSVIEVENLSKSYLVGHQSGNRERYVALRDVVARGVKDVMRKTGDAIRGRQIVQGDEVEEFWALRDVSFQINPGEVVGVIGRNGAGKSTLLKVLSRITEPTKGRVTLRGRTASLLEVGTGFHPELSGRENIFLNGAILGMTRQEIRSKFDEIVAFAEIEKFLDTPVKRYSSGMYVRLAFAVAAHLEPEILIIDEVLAVGDASFQKKCLGKMRDVSGKDGRTVLFVSHNMTAVRSLCSRAILLRSGQIVADDAIDSVVHTYENTELKEALHRKWEAPTGDGVSGPAATYLKEAKVLAGGRQAEAIRVNDSFDLAFCVHSDRRANINLSPHYIGSAGETLFAAPSPLCLVEPGDTWFVCKIPADLLNDGIYSVRLLIVEEGSKVLQTVNDSLVVEVHDLQREGAWLGKWPGVIRPKFDWRVGSDNLAA